MSQNFPLSSDLDVDYLTVTSPHDAAPEPERKKVYIMLPTVFLGWRIEPVAVCAVSC